MRQAELERAMTDSQTVIDELRIPTRELRSAIPEEWKGFSDLHQATMRDGALSGRVKELESRS
jgi:hypothetical protein